MPSSRPPCPAPSAGDGTGLPAGQATGAGPPDGYDRAIDGGAGFLLAAHVPLSLLLDLADPHGPRSRDLLQAEGGEAGWLRPRRGI